jgi:hypothetical protein
LGLDGTTGPLRQRIIENGTQLERDGQILRSPSVAPIEITRIKINLDEGVAEVDACTSSATQLLDAETLDVITEGDPTDTATSRFELRLIDNRWLINEWFASGFEGNPVRCEIDS